MIFLKLLTVFVTLYNYWTVQAIPAASPDFVGRSDLFMLDPFYVGLPGLISDDDVDDSDYPPIVDIELQRRTNVGFKDGQRGRKNGMQGRNDFEESDDEESGDQWPGRHDSVNLTNTAGDVLAVFKENLRMRLKQLAGKADSVDIPDETNKCNEQCSPIRSYTGQAICTIKCTTEGHEGLQDIDVELLKGIMSFCHPLDTIFEKLDELNINSLEQFQKLIAKIDVPIFEASANIPWRAALIKLIKQVQSPLLPLRELITAFETGLYKQKTTEDEKNQLVGENPRCYQFSVIDAILKTKNIITKHPSLADYILFQGYAVTDSVTKYVEEFITKKNFAVQLQIYDMLLGTTCGLYLYGTKGETSDCDQYGGYPEIDMPVPDYMWPQDKQDNCERIREELMLKGESMGKPNNEAGGAGTKKPKVRRKRSLIVRKR